MTEQQHRSDFVTQRELFDALTTVTKEEREDRHELRNTVTKALTDLDSNMDTRLRAVELNLTALQTTAALRLDPEVRLRSLEASRDEIRGALALLRGLVAVSTVISMLVGIVELLRAAGVLHP